MTFSKNLFAISSLILLASACKNFPSANKNIDAVATYDGGTVSKSDVNYELNKLIAKDAKLKGLTFDKLNAAQKETIIKEVVLKELALQEAKKRNLNHDQDYQDALKNFESELLMQKLLLSLTKEASSETNVKKNYAELAEKLKNKKDYKISYIALKTKSDADAVYKNISKSPNSFASEAKKKSIDKDIAKKGGELGFVLEDILPAEVVKEAKTLKKGAISKPISANNKWLVIKCEGERPAQILPYEKAKDALAQSLAKKAIEDFVKQSLEKAKVEISVK